VGSPAQITIIGNGVAGITAAFTLRARDAQAGITVISGESEYFYSRTALMYAFMDRMTLRDLEPHERRVYKQNRIARRHARVINLDANAQSLTLSSGEQLPYSKLLIATGSVPRTHPWPGLEESKEGVVHFVSLQDLQSAERLVPSTRRAVVVGGGLIGVELVECLRHHGIEVTFLVREPWYWPAALAEDEGEIISAHIASQGVDLRHGVELASIIPDATGRVRAVTTTQGETIECQMLGISIGVQPAIQWLASTATPPALGRGIQVDTGFRTSLPNVYAAGDCAELPNGQVEQIWYSAKRQGELAARSLLGDDIQYTPPLFFNSAKFFDIEYTTVGQVTRLPQGASSRFRRTPGRNISTRIVEKDGAVIGFNMLGSRWNHEILETWIHQKLPTDEAERRLHEARFDVEFTRHD
jgi:NAD(P)H-nitrite reductase large subunit